MQAPGQEQHANESLPQSVSQLDPPSQVIAQLVLPAPPDAQFLHAGSPSSVATPKLRELPAACEHVPADSVENRVAGG